MKQFLKNDHYENKTNIVNNGCLGRTNTHLSLEAITDDSEITKGLGSLAFGMTASYNKINGGLFFGADYAVGQKAEIWNHNKKPWLGIGFGYKIF